MTTREKRSDLRLGAAGSPLLSRPRRPPLLIAPLLVLAALVTASCSAASEPELVAVTETPVVETGPTPTVVATPTAAPTPTPAPTAPPTPTPVANLTRGVTKSAVTIGIIKSALVFGDVEVGVAARVRRANANGGIGGRTIEIARIEDDEADPARAEELARQMVEEDGVFAVVLASVAAGPGVTDFLADSAVPFFGWGFSAGFCEPNQWGFGFNGCLIGSALGNADAAVDVSGREALSAYLGSPPSIVLVTSDDDAGSAAADVAAEVWGDLLAQTVRYSAEAEAPLSQLTSAIETHQPDAVVLKTPLSAVIDIKRSLIDAFPGPVVDDAAYLPGLLGDFQIADALEGGFSLTQFPPQEEYREVTGVLASDLESTSTNLIYSQAVSLGYWAADLFVAIGEAVEGDLDTGTFFAAANVQGVAYNPGLDGAPCGFDTKDAHLNPAGGAALVEVRGGIYRPAVSFACYPPE